MSKTSPSTRIPIAEPELELSEFSPAPLGKDDRMNSYGQILKSSSIIGGAYGLNYLIGMVRTKLVAVLLGPSGVGLVGLYISATSLVGTITGLGLGSSGVREVAEACSTGDAKRVARSVKTLRRACFVSGVLGWLVSIAFSYPLSLWAFDSGERAWAMALLGASLLFGVIASGQTALLQGSRRISDLARLNVVSVLASTTFALAVYAWLGEKGIVPVLIGTALSNLGFSWWFARRVPIAQLEMGWAETWRQSKRLVGLGLAFMWSGLLAAAGALAIRAIIVRELGIDANGIYQAAWGISGMFAGFILSAMSTDFYPRITAASSDHREVNRLVNEQTEIGILLALPGLLGTLTFAPWIMHIFYSARFLPGAELLPWFILGIFGQVLSWPMSFALIATRATRWYVFVESVANIMRLSLSIVLLRYLGLWGTALAVPLLYIVYTLLLLLICRRLTGFRWAPATLKLTAISAVLIFSGFFVRKWFVGYSAFAGGAVLTALTCLLSLRGIVARLGAGHRIVQMACRIPCGRFACGI